ncbi:monovalent cation:H+ antiporter [Aureococcus anophagefferens]|uniref:Monovalent cation:H+ antiporter n=1 Tax=Aureococcus anophagefferens TaxID=44056 RepID=A0ABR1FHT8_AURAN
MPRRRKSLATAWRDNCAKADEAPTNSVRQSARDLFRAASSARASMTLRRPKQRVGEAHDKTFEEGGVARWKLKEWLLGHGLGQFVLLFVVACGLVLSGAAAWIGTGAAKTSDYNMSFRDAVWFSWGVFFDPGTQTGLAGDERLAPKVVAVVFSILGFVFNLVLLGLIVERVRLIMATWVQRYGKTVVTGHILVLGWTDRTLFLLGEIAEMAQSHAEGWDREVIVVLGELDERTMRGEIVQAFPSWGRAFPNVDVVCREGKSFEVEDLAKVSAQAAATIIVLGASQSPRDADAQTVSTVLALRAMAAAPQSALLAELRLSQSTHVFHRLGGERRLVPILAATLVDAVLVRCALAPAVGAVCLDLLSFKGNDVEVVDAALAGVEGLCFGEVRRRFEDAVVLGLAPDGATHVVLAPSDDVRVRAGDGLVAVAHDASFADAKKRPPDKGGSKVAPADDCKASAPEDGADIVLEPTKRVLDVALVGWNARVGPLCREIDRHVGAGSRVLILSEKRLEERRVLLEEEGLALDGSKLAIVEEPGLANATLEHLVGFPTDKTQLKRLPLTRLEAAIVMADEASDKRATGGSELQLQDSETVTSTVLLRDLHERLVKHGLATNTLTIVPQLLDILTARVFATNADILEERAETTYDSSDSEDDYERLPDAKPDATFAPIGKTLIVHRNFLETAALTSSALSEFGVQTIRALLGLDFRLGRHAVGEPCLRALDAADVLGERVASYGDAADAVRRRTGGVLLGWSRLRRGPPRFDRDVAYDPPVVNPTAKGEPLPWQRGDGLIVALPPSTYRRQSLAARAKFKAVRAFSKGLLLP